MRQQYESADLNELAKIMEAEEVIVNNVFEAAYCKCKGFEIGKITYNKAQNIASIQIVGKEEDIKRCINDYYMNGQVDAKKYADEVGFIKYTITKKAKA